MKLLFCAACLFITLSTWAQEVFQFQGASCQIPEIKECAHDKLLGETISVKLEQFNQIYTKKVNCGPPSYISSVEIKKPDLYYSVQKLTHHYRKCMRKDILSLEKVEKEMIEIINKSIAIFNQKTDSVEQELRQANNSKEIIRVFDRIVIQ
jgi:hypothetical protein